MTMLFPAFFALGLLLLAEKIIAPLGKKGTDSEAIPLEPGGRYKFVTVFREPVTPAARAAIRDQLENYLADLRDHLDNAHTIITTGYYGGPPQVVKAKVMVSAPFGVYQQMVGPA